MDGFLTISAPQLARTRPRRTHHGGHFAATSPWHLRIGDSNRDSNGDSQCPPPAHDGTPSRLGLATELGIRYA